ncbi:DBP10CT domain protein [Opisthorchis viverrini]|uniref:DBP10CT domain protein n=1 Tax=Opisthorchis viverrini TaxID=6198 RepID=A0A1S8WQ08_OPIVI|nr:DBP10CT domain protein [Opisthorchis viverrini]
MALTMEVSIQQARQLRLRPAGSRLRKQVWDRKKKRYVDSEAAEGKANLKRIKTESGIWIPASYKTDRYNQWIKRSNVDQGAPDSGRNVGDISQPHTSFSARFGGVVEFPEEPEEPKNRPQDRFKAKRNAQAVDRKGFKAPTSKGKSTDEVHGTKFKVLGTKPWCEWFSIFPHFFLCSFLMNLTELEQSVDQFGECPIAKGP